MGTDWIKLWPGVLAAALATPALAQDIPVKLGVLTDMSGIFSDFSGQGSVVAAQMAVDDFMAETDGVTVELVSADHQNKPDVGANIARSWYDQDGVNAILDVPVSSIAAAVVDISNEKGGATLLSAAASSIFTRESCRPSTVQWTYDTDAFAAGTGRSLVETGASKWFFITADYNFGHTLQETVSKVVIEGGGEVVGSVAAPVGTTDFSSFLLQAMSSGADVVALAGSGGDTSTAIKQAFEFGLPQSGQRLASMTMLLTDAKAIGLETAQGLVLTGAFYWDMNDQTREWSQRFHDIHGAMPTMTQAGVYSVTRHYLDAVKATGSTDGVTVVEEMKAAPYVDPLFGEGRVRADGRAIHDLYLFQIKTPEESQGEWDLYKQLAVIDGDSAYQPMLDECDFLK